MKQLSYYVTQIYQVRKYMDHSLELQIYLKFCFLVCYYLPHGSEVCECFEHIEILEA
jgi:hypothetical protein